MLPLIPLLLKIAAVGVKISKVKTAIDTIIAVKNKLTQEDDREPVLQNRVDPEMDNPPHEQKPKKARQKRKTN